MTKSEIVSICAADKRFVLSAPPAGGPRLLYWGPADAYEARPEPDYLPLPSSPDHRVENKLFPLNGEGFSGEPALLAERNGDPFFALHLKSIVCDTDHIVLSYDDASNSFRIQLTYQLDASGILRAAARIENIGSAPLRVHRLNALNLPLPRSITTVDATYGGWANEGHSARVPLTAGKLERTGRAGRPGFEGGPHLILCSDQTTETAGPAIGLALATSANFTIAAERLGHGETQAIAAEWLLPGEVTLEPGEAYETPRALVAISMNGFCGVSGQFHAYARRIAPPRRKNRPVQLNSWEAVYFNVDEKTAMRLADDAAAIGAERFVLDDGWFKGRNNDRAALGDWTPDPMKFPNGLEPLARHVASLGMEFGLWFEPEMVSEDSDLFRNHPDWILAAEDLPRATGRNQLVLDLHREDIKDYLFGAIDKLIRTLDLRYVKWDCNRDLFPAASHGRPATHRQIDGLYMLIDRLHATHPDVSFESCASGGGRMDFGVAARADRFWPSDATDPFERARIQRRASIFYPLEMLGAHVGASPNHITGRTSSMAFRCLAAFFGHFGVELDPSTLNAFDRQTLARAIALYKEHRDILIDGRLIRFDGNGADLDVQAVVAETGDRVLLRILRVQEPDRLSLPPVTLNGLPKATRWQVSELFFDGADKEKSFGEYSSEHLRFAGGEFNVPHAGHGRLFLMERI